MHITEAASEPSLHNPHTLIFFVATLACLAITVVAPWIRRDRSGERRVFWAATAGAAVFAVIASLPDWKLGVGMSLFVGGLTVFTAYFNGSYIKIRGKIYAFHVRDCQAEARADGAPASDGNDIAYDQAPDSYGGLTTARKFWWLAVSAVAILSFSIVGYIIDKEKVWLAVISCAIIFLTAIVLGYGDASWGYSIARRQRIQFGIIAVITAGTFTILYLGAYYAAKRWPLRRKESMEYRAHPRHQKRYP